jgi:hypothetical protein
MLDKSQKNTLEGLLFWVQEKRIQEKANQDTAMAEHAIKEKLKDCDAKNIPFSFQNKVLAADIYSDILDII